MKPLPAFDFSALDGDPAIGADAPPPATVALFLHHVFTLLESAVAAGAREDQGKRELRLWLSARCPWLPSKPDSLQRVLNRELKAWRDGGRKAAALFDHRTEANAARRKPLPKADLDRLVGTALYGYGGECAPAFRRLVNEGALSRETLSRFAAAPSRIGYMPHAVRCEVIPRVAALLPFRRGPRQGRLAGAHLTLDWSTVNAGDFFSADDFTLEVLFARPDGTLTRGQFLPMLDARSRRILDFILIPERGYTALDIKRLIAHCADRVGLPRRRFIFENGNWRSNLVGGGVPWDDTISSFYDRLGIEVQHTSPGNPRGKAFLENAGKSFQALLRDVPGWVGPNEQVIKIEAVQRARQDVEAGRKTPEEAGFLELEQWHAVLEARVAQYNATTQESRVMGGNREVRMSPDEAWEALQPRDAAGNVVGLVRLPPELRYLVANHAEERRVTRNGFRFTAGGETYRYRCEELADFIGVNLKTYWDPETPDLLTVLTPAGETLIVPRNYDTPADANCKILSQDIADKNRFNQRMRGLLSKAQSAYTPPALPVVSDAKSRDLGRTMRAAAEQVELARRHRAQTTARVQRKAARAGVPREFTRQADKMTERGLDLLKKGMEG